MAYYSLARGEKGEREEPSVGRNGPSEVASNVKNREDKIAAL